MALNTQLAINGCARDEVMHHLVCTLEKSDVKVMQTHMMPQLTVIKHCTEEKKKVNGWLSGWKGM